MEIAPDAGVVARARVFLEEARRPIAFTGAGVSADVGVPTFRGPGGLWKEFRAEELATPAAFRRDPRLVWEWYGWRRERVGSVAPGDAHVALARWSRRTRATIVTQNVDGLHERGAAALDPPAPDPIALHGSLFRMRCTGCGERAWDDEAIDARDVTTLPRCSECSELLRPDIVWFGESLEPGTLEAALDAAASADLCLVVGTSGRVYPAASIPRLVKERGGRVVEVNPEPSDLTPLADVTVTGRAGVWLPRLLDPLAGI